jgi:hypothetical protein
VGYLFQRSYLAEAAADYSVARERRVTAGPVAFQACQSFDADDGFMPQQVLEFIMFSST